MPSTSLGSPEPPAGSTPAGDGAATGESRRRPWWPFAAVFVGGLVVGILLAGLLNIGTPDFAAQAQAGQQTAPSSPSPSPDVSVAAQANVNAACLRVINEAQDTYGALAGLQDAIRALDLSALDDIVRRLQPIQPRLASDLRDCRVSVTAPGGSSPSPTAIAPTPSATGPR